MGESKVRSAPQLLPKVSTTLEIRLSLNPGLSSAFLVLCLVHQRCLSV